MAKEESVQKKKTLGNTIARIVFKSLIAVAILIFMYVFYEKVDFSGSSYTPKNSGSSYNSSTPNELKWFNDFKGVENVPNKNAKKQSSGGSQNFMQYEAAKNK